MITGKCKVGCPKKNPTYQEVRRERAKEEFVKGDPVQIIGSGTAGTFFCYLEEKPKNKKKGRRVCVIISGVHDMSMREKEIQPLTIVGVDTAKGKDETVIVQLSRSSLSSKDVLGVPTPKTRFGWRFESANLKLGYGDERPIVIGEALSVQEVPGTNTSRARTIEVGGFGLHAYKSFRIMLSNDIGDYISLVELSGKVDDKDDRRISAETRRCLGLVLWKPVLKQVTAKLMLPYAKKLKEKYPEMNLLVEILEARSRGEAGKKETRTSLIRYLHSLIAESEVNNNRGWGPFGLPFSKFAYGPMIVHGGCRHPLDEMEEIEREMSKPPKEYSVIVDMLLSRMDKAREDVICELMGVKAFEKAKKFAKKVEILEKALKDVSDLKLDELPKFFCRRILDLFKENNDGIELESAVNFLYAMENYDSFDLHIKESLESQGIADVGLKEKRNEFANGVYTTLEKEFTSIMKLSLETKKIIDKI